MSSVTKRLADLVGPTMAVLVGCSSGSGTLQPGEQPLPDVAVSCPSELYSCDDECVELQQDSRHCGACGESCGLGMVCASGQCVCAPDHVECGARCADLDTDAVHCGRCNAPCAAGHACTNGACADPAACVDECAVEDGVAWGCRERFMYGMNYAWYAFAADFGGIRGWRQQGVSGNPDIEADFAELQASGVSVLRWWVWPSFRGEGVRFDADETPTGLGGTAIDDLRRALELADRYDIYLMLCLFSFDNFEPSGYQDTLWVPGMAPIALDPDKRVALLDQVVRPFAREAEDSPYRDHLIAWDVINEPEWAMHGRSKYGDPPFDPWGEHETLTHDEMESFLADVVSALRQESSALVTVGGAALKWRYVWKELDLDFYQFHIYDWVNEDFPYSMSPAEYEVVDKPIVMGEFPAPGLEGVGYPELLRSWYDNGYAGALSWQYNQHRGRIDQVRAFADQHPCETRY